MERIWASQDAFAKEKDDGANFQTDADGSRERERVDARYSTPTLAATGKPESRDKPLLPVDLSAPEFFPMIFMARTAG